MSSFEFIFSLYSLLLGLALVELLTGLGRTVKARLHVAEGVPAGYRVGWLTPLLALFVMLDLLSFWSAAWLVRDLLNVSGATLMGVMLFASVYYLASHLVFPDAVPANGDLDPHYFRVRRIVLALLFILLVVQLGFYATQPAIAPLLLRPWSLGLTLLLVLLMAAAAYARSVAANILILSALVLRYAVGYLIF